MSATRAATGREGASRRGRARRFALVGVVNTAIDFVGFGLLSAVGLPLVLANFLSTSAGMTFGFFAHRTFSFRSERPWRETVVPFLVATATGLWVVQPVVIWLVGDLLAATTGTHTPLVEVWLPKGCAIVVAVVWNFALYHSVVFSAKDGERS